MTKYLGADALISFLDLLFAPPAPEPVAAPTDEPADNEAVHLESGARAPMRFEDGKLVIEWQGGERPTNIYDRTKLIAESLFADTRAARIEWTRRLCFFEAERTRAAAAPVDAKPLAENEAHMPFPNKVDGDRLIFSMVTGGVRLSGSAPGAQSADYTAEELQRYGKRYNLEWAKRAFAFYEANKPLQTTVAPADAKPSTKPIDAPAHNVAQHVNSGERAPMHVDGDWLHIAWEDHPRRFSESDLVRRALNAITERDSIEWTRRFAFFTAEKCRAKKPSPEKEDAPRPTAVPSVKVNTTIEQPKFLPSRTCELRQGDHFENVRNALRAFQGRDIRITVEDLGLRGQ